jgi:hypothetical protein
VRERGHAEEFVIDPAQLGKEERGKEFLKWRHRERSRERKKAMVSKAVGETEEKERGKRTRADR